MADQDSSDTIADHVAYVRRRLSLRPGELAERLGVSQSTVYRWERGAPVHPIYVLRLDQLMKEYHEHGE